MITYEEIKQANEAIKTTTIQKKEYAEVNQRIKAFRMVYPEGFIRTEMVSNENGVCIFRVDVGYEDENRVPKILATGTAYEKEGSTFINKTSYIENCETSAVGRALGMAGFGIDTSVASAEEVQNAIANQNDDRKATEQQLAVFRKLYTGENMEKLLKKNNLEKLEDMPMKLASDIIAQINGGRNG